MKKSTWRARPRGDTQCSVCISVCVPLACRVEARVEQNTITGDSAPLRVLPARERRSNAVCYRRQFTLGRAVSPAQRCMSHFMSVFSVPICKLGSARTRRILYTEAVPGAEPVGP